MPLEPHDPRDIPILTDAVNESAPASLSDEAKAVHAAILTETLELADQIKSFNQQGLTILLIEHKLDVVAMLADRVIVLDHGEKIAEGPPEVVRRDEEVIRAYLGRSTAFA